VRAQVGLSLFTDFENFHDLQAGSPSGADVTGICSISHRLGWRLEAPSHAEERLASVTAS